MSAMYPESSADDVSERVLDVDGEPDACPYCQAFDEERHQDWCCLSEPSCQCGSRLDDAASDLCSTCRQQAAMRAGEAA